MTLAVEADHAQAEWDLGSEPGFVAAWLTHQLREGSRVVAAHAEPRRMVRMRLG